MTMPEYSMRQLLEAGVHYGHTTRRWNPKMKSYIFGVRNGIHILDLEQSVPMLNRALKFIRDTAASGGKILFVGTKHQASDVVANAAKRCGQYYVNHRWLGGMLTNWKTISNSIRGLKSLSDQIENHSKGLTKKELLTLNRDHDKLERSLGGIKDMGGVPDLIFVIDTNKEALAIQEANKLSIPVVAILDSNSDPHGVTFPIPGNDDAVRALSLYCDLISGAILDGLQAEMLATGVDLGESAELPDGMSLDAEGSENAENIGQNNSVAHAADRKVAKDTQKTPAKKPVAKKAAPKKAEDVKASDAKSDDVNSNDKDSEASA